MKINITNIEKLQAELDKVQKKCTARTVTAQEIVDTLNSIAVPKCHLHGTKVRWNGAEKFPHAYNYTPESTHWWAENINGKWYIVDIFRDTCPNRESKRGLISYSQDAKDWIIEQARYL